MRTRRSQHAAVAAAACCALLLETAPAAAVGEEIDGDATSLLSPQRIAARPAAERGAWARYLEASARLQAADRAVVDAELRALGRSKMTPAPYRKLFRVDATMTPTWLASADGRRMAESLMSFQTPSGGWSKHIDFSLGPRRPGQSYYSENDGWHYIATIDNDATTEELRFLAAAAVATADPRLGAAFARGLGYLYAAQFPNGCWPQVYPLQGGYHDAITTNDDALVNVLRVLDDVAAGRLGAADVETKARAAAAVARGTACIVAAQITDGGTRAIWAQQHDPLSFEPVGGRSYELPGLAGRESARVMAFLMTRPAPAADVVEAVHAAATWFRAHAIVGYEYDGKTGLKPVAGAGPIWARLYELGTARPMFANRDGVRRYDWNELGDRRFGYAWYSKEPAAVLTQYDAWAVKHPRSRTKR